MHNWLADKWLRDLRRGRKRYEVRQFDSKVQPGDIIRWNGEFYSRIMSVALFDNIEEAAAALNIYPGLWPHEAVQEYCNVWQQTHGLMAVRLERCARPNVIADK